jgi:ribosomal protein S27E
MKKRTLRESITKHDAPFLTYRCPECGGYTMFNELTPVKKQRHANSANHVMLRLRCAKEGCSHTVVIHHGSVSHRKRFRIRRYPR